MRNGEQKSNGVVRTTSESWFSRSPDLCLPPRCSARSFSNFFCLLDESRSSLAVIHTLREESNPSLKSQLRKLLAKEDVCNKDRMAIEPVIRLTSPDELKDVIRDQAKRSGHVDSRQIDLVTVFDAILTSRQTREKLQCLYENLMSNNFHKTAFLNKISFVN